MYRKSKPRFSGPRNIARTGDEKSHQSHWVSSHWVSDLPNSTTNSSAVRGLRWTDGKQETQIPFDIEVDHR